MDFAELDAHVKVLVLERLDHTYLNEICDNPTAERLASLIGTWLDESGIEWSSIRLWETRRGSVLVTRAVER